MAESEIPYKYFISELYLACSLNIVQNALSHIYIIMVQYTDGIMLIVLGEWEL